MRRFYILSVFSSQLAVFFSAFLLCAVVQADEPVVLQKTFSTAVDYNTIVIKQVDGLTDQVEKWKKDNPDAVLLRPSLSMTAAGKGNPRLVLLLEYLERPTPTSSGTELKIFTQPTHLEYEKMDQKVNDWVRANPQYTIIQRQAFDVVSWEAYTSVYYVLLHLRKNN